MDMHVWKNYLDKLHDHRKAELVLYVLETALNYAPEAIKDMPYGVPGLKLRGKDLIAVAAHKEHLGIYPFSPAVVEKIISSSKTGSSKGTIKYTFDNPPINKDIKKIVTLRKEEIEKQLV